MRNTLPILLVLLALLRPTPSHAHWAFDEFDFRDGATWELVGVSLYNTVTVPFQDEMKTWIVRDTGALNQMRSTWVFSPYYDDFCEWHYSLKLYRNQKLMKTLRINLHCNYIKDGVLSFVFRPEMLYQYKPHMERINWSSISYYNLQNLRTAAQRFNETDNLYLYDDIRPFLFDGFFVIGLDDLYWRVDRDSIQREVEASVRSCLGSDQFFVEPSFLFLSESFTKLSLRYTIYCNETEYYTYKRKVPENNVTAGWRDHFAFLPSTDPRARRVQIFVIGMTRNRYAEIMRGLQAAPIDATSD
jgi:hypothetical protein